MGKERKKHGSTPGRTCDFANKVNPRAFFGYYRQYITTSRDFAKLEPRTLYNNNKQKIVSKGTTTESR